MAVTIGLVLFTLVVGSTPGACTLTVTMLPGLTTTTAATAASQFALWLVEITLKVITD